MKKKLTSKEELFCTYYCAGRNGREAAAKSGYRFAEKAAQKLLSRKEIRCFIEKVEKSREKSNADITAGYARLAFGCVADAVSLLFSDDLCRENIEALDLFNVSEIKRQKGGAIEIKFFDRLKALEKLSEHTEKGNDAVSSLYDAIGKSAASITEAENE